MANDTNGLEINGQNPENHQIEKIKESIKTAQNRINEVTERCLAQLESEIFSKQNTDENTSEIIGNALQIKKSIIDTKAGLTTELTDCLIQLGSNKGEIELKNNNVFSTINDKINQIESTLLHIQMETEGVISNFIKITQNV